MPKISELTALAECPAATDEVALNDGGSSKRLAVDYLQSWRTLFWAGSSQTLTTSQQVLPVATTSGAVTLTLPDATANQGKQYTFIKRHAANTVTIAAAGSDTIDGAATLVLSNQYDSVTIIAAGSQWFTIADNR